MWEALGDEYVSPPSTERWKNIADNYFTFSNFPNCVGSIDGKHIIIQAPKNAGSQFFNYKGTHSISLMAVCDARYSFTLFDIGSSGRHSDGGVLAHSAFGQVMERGEMNLPLPCPRPGTDTVAPLVILGDAAFPLRVDLMRPYPGHNLPEDQAIFNYRLSRARRVIENTFGILSVRWRIFRRPILAKPDNVNAIVKATICLHNFLRQSDIAKQPTQRYCPPGFADTEDMGGNVTEGQWRKEVGSDTAVQPAGRIGSNHYGLDAASVRNTLKIYFFSKEGTLPWQLQRVRRGEIPDTDSD